MDISKDTISLFLLILALYVALSEQHAYLSDPPSRASAWLNDDDFAECCKNYDYNQMFCGGANTQWAKNGGECGICGDAFDEPEPRTYEKGGKKYLGKIVKRYTKGDSIPVTVQITANHLGFFEFRICNVDGWKTDATQKCLNNTVLKIQESDETRYMVQKEMDTASYSLKVPSDFTCKHCVLQWKYVTGNSWGMDSEKNVSCLGCGVVQENFMGCADIAILDDSMTDDDENNDDDIVSSTIPISSTTIETTTIETSDIETTEIEPITATEYIETDPIISTTVPIKTTEQIATTSSAVEEGNSNGCRTKLEFGTKINVSKVLSIYCNRMCKLKCDDILKRFGRSSPNYKPDDKDIIACTETCPILCSCN